jgi:hypothetical protein
MIRHRDFAFVAVGLLALLPGSTLADDAPEKSGIADYRPVSNWPQLPPDVKLGRVSGVATDSADRVYVFHRGKQPILVFDRDGKFLRSWGDGVIDMAQVCASTATATSGSPTSDIISS